MTLSSMLLQWLHLNCSVAASTDLSLCPYCFVFFVAVQSSMAASDKYENLVNTQPRRLNIGLSTYKLYSPHPWHMLCLWHTSHKIRLLVFHHQIVSSYSNTFRYSMILQCCGFLSLLRILCNCGKFGDNFELFS